MRINRQSLSKSFVCLAPSIFLYSFFFTLPVCMGVLYSLSAWDGISSPNFVGIQNYINLFTDNSFWSSILRSLFFAFASVFFSTILAVGCAVALTNKFKGNIFSKTLLFLPNLMSMVIVGFIWKFLFSNISTSLSELTGLSFFDISWLGDERFVLWALIFVSVWQGMGYYMIIYMAGLLAIDDSYIEAARIDGASERQIFWKIKLPLAMPTITIGIFMNFAFCMKCFDLVYSMTSGGPGTASEVAVLNIYREAFVYNNYGYGCAKAIVFACIIILFSLVQRKLTLRKEGTAV